MNVPLTSAEVMARTGITGRQLQWWDERGIVVPARAGHRRLYSMNDLAEIAVICDLRRRGFSLQRVRKVIRLLQKEFKKRLVDTVSVYSEYHLLTDGKHIFLKDSAEQVIDVLKNSRQPMLAVCLTDTVRQLQTELAGRALEHGEIPEQEQVSIRDTHEKKPVRRKSAMTSTNLAAKRGIS